MSYQRCFLIIAVLVLSTLTQDLFAKKFRNEFIEFEIPNSWECSMEGAEWICQSTKQDRQREAIIIMAAKKRGAEDSMELYQSYLKKKKTFSLPGGKTMVSEPKYTKLTQVNNHKWVDALHLASEIPGFYTRYLATVKHDVAVAVTFSVAKNYYNAYKNPFDRIVGSMRIFKQGDVSSSTTQPTYKVRPKSSSGSDLDDVTFIPDDVEKYDIGQVKTPAPKKGSGSDDDSLIYIILLLAVGVYIYIRKKKGSSDLD